MLHADLRYDVQRLLGLCEREIAPALLQGAPAMRTGIDVGAGDGYYTLYFLGKTSARRVYAFEPSAAAMEALERNLRTNSLLGDRIVLSSLAVAERADSGVTTLDSIVQGVEVPCLVKIDVEGREADVLAGAKELLALQGITWIIETHSAALEHRCAQILETYGYRTRIVRPAWWRVIVPEWRPLPHNRWLVGEREG